MGLIHKVGNILNTQKIYRTEHNSSYIIIDQLMIMIIYIQKCILSIFQRDISYIHNHIFRTEFNQQNTFNNMQDQLKGLHY